MADAPERLSAQLTPAEQRLVDGFLRMYRDGWFPMLMEEGPGVEWVQPEHRAIIPLDDRFKVSKTLAQRVRSGRFIVTHDRAFGEVIRACAAPAKGREDTWLDPSIIDAFLVLHKAGHAHSVEAWLPPAGRRDGGVPEGSVLVGGLYGLGVGSVFCGESMFSRPELGGTDASKVCLVNLVQHLRKRGFTLLDAQLSSEHLERFGMYEMPKNDYVAHVAAHAEADVTW